MKKLFILALVLVFSMALLQGCGDDSSDDSQGLKDLIDETPDGGGGDGGGNVEPPGTLGDLVDLGDLVFPAGDHWYYTRAEAINDQGTVIGESNQGNSAAGAFKWEPGLPAEDAMTFLGIHGEFDPTQTYDDYYMQMVEDPIEFPHPFVFSEAVDINNSGTIIGNSLTGLGPTSDPNEGEKRAFIWKDGVFTDLPPIPGIIKKFRAPGTDGPDDEGEIDFEINKYSAAADINEKGEVVLTLDDNTESGRHAYYWDGVSFTNANLGRDDVSIFPIVIPAYEPLATIVGETSEAVAINENGQALMNSGGTALFVDRNWDILESLNGLPGASLTVAVDINDSIYTNNDEIPDGHVIGNSGDFDRVSMDALLNNTFLGAAEGITMQDAGLTGLQGFFWDGGAMYPIDHLGGGASIAADINNKDQVVGGALTAEENTHAFLWTLGPDKKGIIQDLGTLGGANSMALNINEAGQIVGWSETGEFYMEQGFILPIRHGFLWDNGTMYDLGTHDYFYDFAFTPPYPFSEAVDVNELGELTGNSITINAHPRGFYLNPDIPVP